MLGLGFQVAPGGKEMCMDLTGDGTYVQCFLYDCPFPTGSPPRALVLAT